MFMVVTIQRIELVMPYITQYEQITQERFAKK